MDMMVLETQVWLNKTYGDNPRFKRISEDGVTGWGTMKGLITALQIELGIEAPNGNFGPATTSSFKNLALGSDKTNQNYILQGGLYCKGYNPIGFDGRFGNGVQGAIKKLQVDAGIPNTGEVNALLMKAILSMDAFTLLNYGEYHGDEQIRTVQKYLNSNYSSNQYFASDIGLVPCDGIYASATNKALLYAFQIEEGIQVPNGVFGPSTTKLAPLLSVGSNKTKFIYILQYLLYCNGFDPKGFNGQFGAGLKESVREFQGFAALSADGIVGMQTWASLLVSTGDKNRKGTLCDCATTITDAKAKTIKNNGYVSVGRYLTGKFKMTQSEINTILSNELKIYPIFETGGYKLSYFNSYQGNIDAKEAIKSAHSFGFDEGTIIYFTVDFDALDGDVTSSILPYFSEIYGVFKRTETKYKIGIYGPRNVCSRVADNGYSCSSFVCDMSSGFSGNLGYPLPKDWAIDQISTITIGSGDGQIEIDNNISSGRDLGVSKVNLGNSANGVEDTATPPGKPSEPSNNSEVGEWIVVSGQEGDENRYKYNFIEPAIKKLIEHSMDKFKISIENNKLNNTITWIIEKNSYTSKDISNFTNTVDILHSLININDNSNNIKVNLVFVSNKNEFINYLNTGSTNGGAIRKIPITEFTLFGHGEKGRLLFGKDYNIEKDDIQKLNSNAFSNTKSIFYSCNTATGDDDSFIYAWHKRIGGKTQACVNKTDYEFITVCDKFMNPVLYGIEWAAQKTGRAEKGYMDAGSKRYPIPSKKDKAYWVYY
ncbi:glycoside hydrolase domain-containing protein [Clostridium hydrogeniformans]|uniref:glycoside hydrolase domain-containing protein n=1 Tax=Clostridium hydrogeniformans TaxID=349933 RepID=UPI00068DE9F7|nr:glycoside hydrolase domain-containing protein [Clostridium hydrogeniformans]